MTANVVREYGVWYFDGQRVKIKTTLFTYGQAMHAAERFATHHPDYIVWLETRVVIQDPWEEVDFDAEEARLAEQRRAQEAGLA